MTVSEAASIGDTECLRALLEAGGDPNEAETEECGPPLLEAASADHVEAARLLLDAGADRYAPHSGGTTSLQKAVESGSIGVFRLLIERGYRIDATREDLPWMLTRAAGDGHLEIVRWLLAQGVPVDSTDFSGCTALIRATHSDHLEVVEELLRAGADPNHRDDDTETVLMWAADHAGNASVLRALLLAGAEVNARSDEEGTALSWTMRHGDVEMIGALLYAGADVNATSVLIHAAYHGYAIVVRMLLERGADPRVINSTGETALALAKNRGHREVANLLRQAEVDWDLRERGGSYPPPRYSMGTHVRTLTGTPREGWIVLVEWNYKHGRYGYYIEVAGTSQVRKTESKRYWAEDLQILSH